MENNLPLACCRMLEIEPKYVDVTIIRWQAFTGLEAIRESDGATFAQASA